MKEKKRANDRRSEYSLTSLIAKTANFNTYMHIEATSMRIEILYFNDLLNRYANFQLNKKSIDSLYCFVMHFTHSK